MKSKLNRHRMLSQVSPYKLKTLFLTINTPSYPSRTRVPCPSVHPPLLNHRNQLLHGLTNNNNWFSNYTTNSVTSGRWSPNIFTPSFFFNNFSEKSDNSVKNHFYSRLRKSLRKLNKIILAEFKKQRLYKELKPNVIYKVIEGTELKHKKLQGNEVTPQDCLNEDENNIELCFGSFVFM